MSEPLTAQATFEGFDARLLEAMTVLYRLSAEDVTSMRDASRALHLPLGEAAVHLGLITRRELDVAIDWSGETALTRTGAGVVEASLERFKQTRAVTVFEGEKVKPSADIPIVQDPYAPRGERIRALRTELLLLNQSANQTFALLSPGRREGRTLLCAELAIAFSQLGRPTLLVDADLRNPGQHLLFNMDNAFGLAQALAVGEAPRMHGVEGFPHLTVLNAGPAPSNPLELISAGRLQRMFAEWRHRHDFILIDTPPTANFSDALAIASLAGQALVMGRAAMTPHRDVKRMLSSLAGTQARVLGAVINEF